MQAFWHLMMSHAAVSLLYQKPSVPNVSLRLVMNQAQMYIHFLICRKLYIHINFGEFLIIQTVFLLAMGVNWNEESNA